MSLKSLVKMLDFGVIFDYPAAGRGVAYSMLNLLFQSPKTMIGFASPLRNVTYAGREGVEMTIKRGVTALFLFPWLTLHECLHALAMHFTGSRAVTQLAPLTMHVGLASLFSWYWFVSIVVREPVSIYLFGFLVLQQLILLTGCVSDVKDAFLGWLIVKEADN